MTTLTEKFTALEEQLAAQAGTMEAYVDTVEAKLLQIANTLDTLNNNGATNTRYLLAALGALDPCKTCPQPSLDVPPVSNIPLVPDDEQCKRVQALLHAISSIAAKFDILNNFGIGFNPTMLGTAFDEIITGLGEPSAVPSPSWAEMANMASQALAYATANFDTGISLSTYFAPLVFDLRDAIYNTGSPLEGKSAYDSVISNSSVPYGANGLLQAIGYNALFSYYLDPANEINLAGYDGSSCAPPTECVTLLSGYSFTITKTEDDGSNFWSIVIPSWADTVEWDVTFSAGLNVIWASNPMVDGDPASGILQADGFTGNDTQLWDQPHTGVSYFGVGAFYEGLPNGSTVDVTINSIIACPYPPE